MSQYFCPYCSPRYQFHQHRSDGIMICGQCGDPLVKKTFIKPTQVFAIVAAAAFISPFILILFGSIQNLNAPSSQPSNDSMAMITPIRRLAD